MDVAERPDSETTTKANYVPNTSVAPPSPSARIRVDDLILSLKVGWTENERKEPQSIAISMELRLRTMPTAVYSDDLSETICYGAMVEKVEDFLANREFCLLEHLAHSVYEFLKEDCGDQALIFINVRKIEPPLEHVRGGVSFCCGDFH